MTSRRAKQVASSIGRAMQEVLARGLADPRITGMVTVTNVDVTDDLSLAKVSVSVLPAERQELTYHGLKSALPKIRKSVMERVPMRTFPRLELDLDEGLKRQAEVFELLAKAKAERREDTEDSDSRKDEDE